MPPTQPQAPVSKLVRLISFTRLELGVGHSHTRRLACRVQCPNDLIDVDTSAHNSRITILCNPNTGELSHADQDTVFDRKLRDWQTMTSV